MKFYLVFIIILLTAAVLLPVAYFFVGWPKAHSGTQYGFTWSTPYAEYLGINSDQGLKAAMDDLDVKYVHLPAYWSQIEANQGQYDFSGLKRQIEIIASHKAKIILILGAKQPRWPEWWIPAWAQELTESDLEAAQLKYVTDTFSQFSSYPAIEAWQVESEPSFTASFGVGNKQPETFIRQEMQLVKQLEARYAEQQKIAPRPIYTTESGELSLWTRYANEVDGIGTSVYRVVVSPTFGPWHYWFVPPWFYARKAALLKPWVKYVFVSEFQMEPWFSPLGAVETPMSQQFKTFDTKQMQDNFQYAERMPMDRIYFWGVEWWYWMKTKNNHPEFWDTAVKFFKTHASLF